MKNYKGFTWIVFDADLLGGKPTVKGTRISVAQVLACLAEGMSGQDISEDYEGFPPEAVPEVLRFAAQRLDEVETNVAA